MSKITKEMLDWTFEDVVHSEMRTVSRNADEKAAGKGVMVNAVMHLQGATLGEVIAASFDPKWISKQGSIRKNFDSIKKNDVVDFQFSSPGKRVETRGEKVEKIKALLGVDDATANWIVDNPGKFAAVRAKVEEQK